MLVLTFIFAFYLTSTPRSFTDVLGCGSTRTQLWCVVGTSGFRTAGHQECNFVNPKISRSHLPVVSRLFVLYERFCGLVYIYGEIWDLFRYCEIVEDGMLEEDVKPRLTMATP